MENISTIQKESQSKNSRRQSYSDIVCIASKILKGNFDRVWKFVRDVSYLQKIATDISGPLTYIKGENTWSLKNEFSFIYVNIFHMNVKCSQILFRESPKKIEIIWDCNSLGIIHKKYSSLYEISGSNQTLAKTVLKFLEINQNLPPKIEGSFFKTKFEHILISYNNYIQNSIEHLIEYQSFLVNKNLVSVWNYVINFRNLGNFSSFIGEHFEINDRPEKKGAFWKCFSAIDKKVNFFKINDVILKKNFRIYVVETFGTRNTFIQQEMRIKVTNVFENKCQVSLMHIFKEKVTEKYLFYFKTIKQDFMEKLKDHLEKI